MNHILLTGRNVKEITLKITPAGKEVASGTIAVQKNFKNQEGKYDSDFVDFVCWGPKAKVIADYVQKGDKFGISGRLATRTYENKEGNKVKVVEVNVEDFDFPVKSTQQGSSNNAKPAAKKFTADPGAPFKDDPFADGIDVSSDELPF